LIDGKECEDRFEWMNICIFFNRFKGQSDGFEIDFVRMREWFKWCDRL